MTDVVTKTVRIVPVTCGKCSIEFGLNETFRDARLADGETFYCPNGHSVFWAETTVKKLEKQLAAERARHDQTKAEVDRQREYRRQTERQLIATRGVVTRVKNRVGRGVCPCCNRFFEQLHRHMKTKHQDYATSTEPTNA